jgi:hypothetical protein
LDYLDPDLKRLRAKDRKIERKKEKYKLPPIEGTGKA